MGALCLLPPGKGALCLDACEDEACRLVREIAARPCVLFKKELGFGVPIYCYQSPLGHADGLDDAHEKALQGLVEALAELAANPYFEGKLPHLEENVTAVDPNSVKRRRARTKKTAVADKSEPLHQASPERIFQAEIPVGRGPKSRKSKRRPRLGTALRFSSLCSPVCAMPDGPGRVSWFPETAFHT